MDSGAVHKRRRQFGVWKGLEFFLKFCQWIIEKIADMEDFFLKCRRRLWMFPLPNLTFTFQGKRSVTLIMNDGKND